MTHLLELNRIINTKRILLLTCMLVVVTTDVLAQGSNMAPPPSEWKRYKVDGEEFSVILPTLPAMATEDGFKQRRMQRRRERYLGAYADGVVYTVSCYENPSPRESVEKFLRAEFPKNKLWDRNSEQDVTRNGFNGKQYFTTDKPEGTQQAFATKKNICLFQAVGAPLDDLRVKPFFDSVSLGEKLDGIEVRDGPGILLDPLAKSESAFTDSGEKVFIPKEVDKRIVLLMKPEPRYTEVARRDQVVGAVVLKAILTSGGSVVNIQVISGLPRGLTERALDAVKKLRFIPAMKDGKFVSVSMQIEYYFNLY